MTHLHMKGGFLVVEIIILFGLDVHDNHNQSMPMLKADD